MTRRAADSRPYIYQKIFCIELQFSAILKKLELYLPPSSAAGIQLVSQKMKKSVSGLENLEQKQRFSREIRALPPKTKKWKN